MSWLSSSCFCCVTGAEAKAGPESGDGYWQGGPSMPEVDFDDPDWEQEAEAMLNWSEELDFESYLSSWHSIGTSATSDYLMNLNAAESIEEFDGAASGMM